jgi:hypothetical protein
VYCARNGTFLGKPVSLYVRFNNHNNQGCPFFICFTFAILCCVYIRLTFSVRTTLRRMDRENMNALSKPPCDFPLPIYVLLCYLLFSSTIKKIRLCWYHSIVHKAADVTCSRCASSVKIDFTVTSKGKGLPVTFHAGTEGE